MLFCKVVLRACGENANFARFGGESTKSERSRRTAGTNGDAAVGWECGDRRRQHKCCAVRGGRAQKACGCGGRQARTGMRRLAGRRRSAGRAQNLRGSGGRAPKACGRGGRRARTGMRRLAGSVAVGGDSTKFVRFAGKSTKNVRSRRTAGMNGDAEAGWEDGGRRRQHKICAVRGEEHKKHAVAADGRHVRGCGGWLGGWRSAVRAQNLRGSRERAQIACGCTSERRSASNFADRSALKERPPLDTVRPELTSPGERRYNLSIIR